MEHSPVDVDAATQEPVVLAVELPWLDAKEFTELEPWISLIAVTRPTVEDRLSENPSPSNLVLP
jgi:hypothetical protein